MGRVPYKLRYSDAVLDQALKLKKAKKKPIILSGDFNTAHKEIDLAQKEIDLLEEYRKSLIAEAVTGKIDVRDYPLT